MLTSVLSAIVCDEFQKQFLDRKCHSQAMVMEFVDRTDYEKEEGFRHLQLLLYAEDNYVGVYFRETWDVRPVNSGECYKEGRSEWQHLSLHDSCWRTDGVDRFFVKFRERIITIYSGWYDTVPVNEYFASELRSATKKARG